MNSKGGPGSGRKPEGGGSKPPYRKPLSGRSRPIGVRPGAAYPHGRNPDGSPRTQNDIRDTNKPIGHTPKPKS